MEYPGSKFTRSIRFATLIMFIAAFVIITPMVILYSAGYRFDFKNGLLLETGSLSIDVLPKTAVVYLDGIKINQTLPIRLSNITPHKYALKISAPGYYDWEKQIEINKNKTTYIKEFILLKKNKPQEISTDNTAEMDLSFSGRYLAYVTSRNNSYQVVVKDEEGKNQDLVIRTSGEPTLRWAPQYDYLAISVGQESRNRMSVVDAIAGSVSEILSADPISKFLWGNTADPNLYYSTKNGIYSFAPRVKQSSLITTSKFLDWYMNNGTLWTMDINTSTLELNISKDSLGFKNLFSSFPTIGAEPTTTFATAKFVTIDRDTVLLRDRAGNNFFIVRPNAKFAINANKYFLSKFNNWWLFWSPYELWTYSENEEPFLLNRSGVKLDNILPLDQFNALALLRDGEITALFPYFYLERSLVTGSVKAMAASPDNRIIYYSDVKGIWKLNY